ncbi:MAG: polysaccharide deacetylase family protein [Deltaproteobacteria bacterium]|nr:polysaccharide deacetylase family protein [Deltaproteobacteria bacterium]
MGLLTGARSIPLVIGYHRVVEEAAREENCLPGMIITRNTLERHLDWIGQRFDFITLDETGARLRSGEGLDKPVATVTFDDGYRDFYTHAFPLLKRKGIPAAVFPVTGLIGTSQLHFFDKLYHLLAQAFSRWRDRHRELSRLLVGLGMPVPERMETRDLGAYEAVRALLDSFSQREIYRVMESLEGEIESEEELLGNLRLLDWEMLSEMRHSGITIGSHTVTHAFLTNETFQKVLDETMLSRAELEKRLGTKIEHFAYPSGRFNPRVVAAVAAADYNFAYTTCSHQDPMYPFLTIPRKMLWENSTLDSLDHFSSALLSCQVHRALDWASPCKLEHRRAWPTF